MENVRIIGVDVLRIYNAQNQIEAEMLTAALKDHGIDCYSQTADTGIRTEQYSVPWYKNSVMAARVLLIGAAVVTGLGILIIKEL